MLTSGSFTYQVSQEGYPRKRYKRQNHVYQGNRPNLVNTPRYARYTGFYPVSDICYRRSELELLGCAHLTFPRILFGRNY